MAVVIQLLPAFEDVPPTNNARAVIGDHRLTASSSCSRQLSNQPYGVGLVQLL
jgi:hypothetical protein